jgi:high-affinity K+ transport system ATPase subunit B
MQQPAQRNVDSVDTVAIIGLVLSVTLIPVGFIVSIVALSRHRNRASNVVAIIGLAVSAVPTLAGTFLLVAAFLGWTVF